MLTPRYRIGGQVSSSFLTYVIRGITQTLFISKRNEKSFTPCLSACLDHGKVFSSFPVEIKGCDIKQKKSGHQPLFCFKAYFLIFYYHTHIAKFIDTLGNQLINIAFCQYFKVL